MGVSLPPTRVASLLAWNPNVWRDQKKRKKEKNRRAWTQKMSFAFSDED